VVVTAYLCMRHWSSFNRQHCVINDHLEDNAEDY